MEGAAVPDFDERLAAFMSATCKELRPGERQVLSAYTADHLDTTDLAIEMPTGEGRTLLALLADWALDQGQPGQASGSTCRRPSARWTTWTAVSGAAGSPG